MYASRIAVAGEDGVIAQAIQNAFCVGGCSNYCCLCCLAPWSGVTSMVKTGLSSIAASVTRMWNGMKEKDPNTLQVCLGSRALEVGDRHVPWHSMRSLHWSAGV